MKNIVFILLIGLSFMQCTHSMEEDVLRLLEGDEEQDINSGNCSEGYQGPQFDIQVDAFCKAAYAYQCDGNTQAVATNCQVYKDWQSQDSSIPDCPYCN